MCKPQSLVFEIVTGNGMVRKTFAEHTSKNAKKPTVQAVSVAPVFEAGEGRGSAEEVMYQLYSEPTQTQPSGRPKCGVKCEDQPAVEWGHLHHQVEVEAG
jgi:hypothetical protein